MSYLVDVLVTFRCDEVRGVRIARQHLESISAERTSLLWGDAAPRAGLLEAGDLLQYLADGKGIVSGPKGARFSWGAVMNYGRVEAMVELLRPFWRELLRSGGRAEDERHRSPHEYDAVLVLHHGEDDDTIQTLHISLVDPVDEASEIGIRRATLPFRFGQEE